jgi:hypothetical protein
MGDQRKLAVLAGASILLIVLTIAYNAVLEELLAGLVDASKRQHRYEQVITKKSLTLHEGTFWKKKE